MQLQTVFQMDEDIHLKTDTTWAFIREAQCRGYQTLCYSPENLAIEFGKPFAMVREISIKDNEIIYGNYEKFILETADIVFIRQNPPFDMRYITSTYILENANVLCVNNPAEIRNCPEKFLPLQFPSLVPPTLITEDISLIKSFFNDYRDIVLKPLYGYKGDGVIHVKTNDSIESIVELMVSKYNCPIIAQKFCTDLTQDRRILLLDGKPIAAMNRRIAVAGEIRTNLRFQPILEKVQLTARDLEICEAIGPELSKKGLIFAGIDILDEFLLEINITSPTGLIQLNKLYSTSLEKMCWDVFEAKIQAFGS